MKTKVIAYTTPVSATEPFPALTLEDARQRGMELVRVQYLVETEHPHQDASA